MGLYALRDLRVPRGKLIEIALARGELGLGGVDRAAEGSRGREVGLRIPELFLHAARPRRAASILATGGGEGKHGQRRCGNRMV